MTPTHRLFCVNCVRWEADSAVFPRLPLWSPLASLTSFTSHILPLAKMPLFLVLALVPLLALGHFGSDHHHAVGHTHHGCYPRFTHLNIYWQYQLLNVEDKMFMTIVKCCWVYEGLISEYSRFNLIFVFAAHATTTPTAETAELPSLASAGKTFPYFLHLINFLHLIICCICYICCIMHLPSFINLLYLLYLVLLVKHFSDLKHW